MEYGSIGAKIQRCRKARGLTQAELAKRIGRTESSVAKYERGVVEIPMSVLEKISTELKVPLNFLLGVGPFQDVQLLEDKKGMICLSLSRLDGIDKFIGKNELTANIDFIDFINIVDAYLSDIKRVNDTGILFSFRAGLKKPELINFGPEELKMVLFGDTEVDDEVLEEVKRYAKFIKEQRRQE